MGDMVVASIVLVVLAAVGWTAVEFQRARRDGGPDDMWGSGVALIALLVFAVIWL